MIDEKLLIKLREVARVMGYDEKWVMSMAARGARYVIANLERLGQSYMAGGHDEGNEQNGIGPMECGWHAGDECDDESLSNSTDEETMESASKKPKTESGASGTLQDGHATQAQDGLDTINGTGPIWTHFPNTQRARLKWRATVFQKDQSTWLANKVPFGNVTHVTSTALYNTGGGSAVDGGDDNDLSKGLTSLPGYDFAQPYLIQLRMTSPYNIMKTLGATNLTNNTRSEPNWIALFDNRYQYYQVNETDWGVRLNFGTPRHVVSETFEQNPDYQNYRLKVFWRYTAQDDPPTRWSLDTFRNANTGNFTSQTTGSGGQIGHDHATAQGIADGGPGATALTSDDYERMGGWKMRTVAWDTTRPCSIHIGGKYKFGQCKMDIKTLLPHDAAGAQAIPTAEGMSLTKSTPAFPELLSIIIVEDYATAQIPEGSDSTRVPFSMQFDTSQLIDFADLRANFKFPTPNCASVAGGQMMTDEQYFWRGAAYS